jgi:ketosteroid isomerase-like protein
MRYMVAFAFFIGSVLPGTAGPREDAFSVIEQFKKAYDASDPPAIVKLFAPDAVFMGTLMQGPTRDTDAHPEIFSSVGSIQSPKEDRD